MTTPTDYQGPAWAAAIMLPIGILLIIIDLTIPNTRYLIDATCVFTGVGIFQAAKAITRYRQSNRNTNVH